MPALKPAKRNLAPARNSLTYKAEQRPRRVSDCDGRHALKNCMVVVLPAIFGEFIGIMSGSIIIEKIFAVPGVGSLYINSIDGRDYALFMLLTRPLISTPFEIIIY